MFMPFIESGIWYLYYWIKRLIDWSFKYSSTHTTKLKTALAYAELYSGPEIEFFEKYPWLLNLAFLAMFYGFIMPYFFIAVLICVFTSYLVDWFTIAYFYRKSPLFDISIQKDQYLYLKWAGFFYGAIAWWNLTNPSIFGNVFEKF